MLKWFRKERRQVESGGIGGSEAISKIPILGLETTIVTTSLLSTAPINEAWPGLTGEEPMSWKSNVLVRMEMLWFFLHMVNRFAFDAGGPEARAVLQDAIAERAIRGVIIDSFDDSHAKKGFKVEEWRARMLTELVSAMNEAELDYSRCVEVMTGGAAGLAALWREDSIVGKLAARIARQVDWSGDVHDVELRLLIAKTAMEALTKSGLKQQVENACRALRSG